MIYFVYTNFQQLDGAIGHTCVNFTDRNTARMEYHAQLAAQYNPSNSANNAWTTVQLVDQNGYIIMSESVTFKHDE